ncbi:MAG TPA: IS110 family transposase [Actinomycetes bacterium]|nr:IS110 family transposase [Actinomycetes bacterium]
MVTLGTDAHKRSHTVVAADAQGRQLGQVTVTATSEGHLRALVWAGQWPERTWAIEDCRHLSRRLERDLLAAGERVVRVPPKLMGIARRQARTRGKSDPIDALAVARAALREPDLPVACLDGVDRQVRLLVDHREDLVAERTRIQQRLRWHLHELEPGWEIPAGALDRSCWLDGVTARLAAQPGLVAELAGELVERCRQLTGRVKELERQLARLVPPLASSLLDLEGCGPLTAAKLIGEVAGMGRFRSRAAFAMHNGTAPIPVWSGNHQRHRLNRGGNRQLNVAMHRIAITQLRLGGTGRAYVQRRLAAGDTKTEAIRALRRRISDQVYRRLRADEHQRHQPTCRQPAA